MSSRNDRFGFALTGAFLALSLILAPIAEAKLTFSDADGKPAKADDPQVKALVDQIDSCARKSDAFRKYVKGEKQTSLKGQPLGGGVDQDPKEINIQLVHDAGILDNAVNRNEKGKVQVNMDNLNRLPDPEIKDGKLDPPPGMPWGMTRCEQLLHIIAEARSMANTNSSLDAAHQAATHIQEGVRIDFKIDQPGAPCHTQRFSNTDATDKVAPKTIHYVDEDGAHDVTPSGQIQLDYGNGNMEVIWFDKKGRLQLAFFHNHVQIPRDKLTLPEKTPDGKKLDPYVSAPGLQDKGGEQYAVNADCNPPPKTPEPPKQTCSKGTSIIGAIDNVTCQMQHG